MLAVKDASSSSNRVDAFIGRERRHAAKASLLSLRPPTRGKVFRHHVTPLGTTLSGLVRVCLLVYLDPAVLIIKSSHQKLTPCRLDPSLYLPMSYLISK